MNWISSSTLRPLQSILSEWEGVVDVLEAMILANETWKYLTI
jgi:hypothetical protein